VGPVNQALKDSGLSPKDLHKILLVGGSHVLPAVQKPLKSSLAAIPSRASIPTNAWLSARPYRRVFWAAT
jgi:molecular chaperone DnaK